MKRIQIVIGYLSANFLIVMGGGGYKILFKDCDLGNDFCIRPGWYLGFFLFVLFFLAQFLFGNYLMYWSISKYLMLKKNPKS